MKHAFRILRIEDVRLALPGMELRKNPKPQQKKIFRKCPAGRSQNQNIRTSEL
jgi:hypothetical protein